MLGFHRQDRTHYNEVIIDAYKYAWKLPGSVEAFFWLRSHGCGERCIHTMRSSHALFIKKFGSAASSVPMLVLDLANAETPFVDAPTSPSRKRRI